MPLYQFDVKFAFLNGELEEKVYICQSIGFIFSSKEDMMYKLKKALYGLKQAPRAWYTKIDSYFYQNGFMRSENEPTLYLKRKDNDFVLVCLYVDDMIYLGFSNLLIQEFKRSMMRLFEMIDLDLLHYFLSFEIKQSM